MQRLFIDSHQCIHAAANFDWLATIDHTMLFRYLWWYALLFLRLFLKKLACQFILEPYVTRFKNLLANPLSEL